MTTPSKPRKPLNPQGVDPDEKLDWLTRQQLQRINSILSNTPMSALPPSTIGMGGRVKTIEGFITYLDSIVTFLKNEMAENEDLKDQVNQTDRDLEAAGRIFGRMGLGR